MNSLTQTAFQAIPECSDRCFYFWFWGDTGFRKLFAHLSASGWLVSASKALVKNILNKNSICLAVTLSQITVFTLGLRWACREAPGFPQLEFLPLLGMEIQNSLVQKEKTPGTIKFKHGSREKKKKKKPRVSKKWRLPLCQQPYLIPKVIISFT